MTESEPTRQPTMSDVRETLGMQQPEDRVERGNPDQPNDIDLCGGLVARMEQAGAREQEGWTLSPGKRAPCFIRRRKERL